MSIALTIILSVGVGAVLFYVATYPGFLQSMGYKDGYKAGLANEEPNILVADSSYLDAYAVGYTDGKAEQQQKNSESESTGEVTV